MGKGHIVKQVVQFPDYQIPSIRNEGKDLSKIILCATGGIGDRIICEPLFRYFTKHYPTYNYEIISQSYYFYKHLESKNIKIVKPEDDFDLNSGVFLSTTLENGTLFAQYVNVNHINHMDFVHLSILGSVLLEKLDRVIYLPQINMIEQVKQKFNLKEPYILYHFSDTENTRKMPSHFYNELKNITSEIIKPQILIGNTTSATSMKSLNLTFPNVTSLIDKTSVEEAVALIMGAETVVTNESYPIHAASAFGSSAKILYFSFTKNNNNLGHWRPIVKKERIEDLKEEDLAFAYNQINLVKNPITNIYFNPIDRFYGKEKIISDETKHNLIDYIGLYNHLKH